MPASGQFVPDRLSRFEARVEQPRVLVNYSSQPFAFSPVLTATLSHTAQVPGHSQDQWRFSANSRAAETLAHD